MIISFGGAIGSGKSTIAKMLSEKLGWPRYYIGGILREQAKQRGLTVEEYYKMGEHDPKIDHELDDYQRRLGETQDNFVIEGRTSYYMIPHSLKIFLEVDEKVAAKRVFADTCNSDNRNESKGIKNVDDVLATNRRRKQSEIKRYRQYYNIDIFDPKNYDFILDTSNLTIDQAFEQVLAYVKAKMAEIDKS